MDKVAVVMLLIALLSFCMNIATAAELGKIKDPDAPSEMKMVRLCSYLKAAFVPLALIIYGMKYVNEAENPFRVRSKNALKTMVDELPTVVINPLYAAKVLLPILVLATAVGLSCWACAVWDKGIKGPEIPEQYKKPWVLFQATTAIDMILIISNLGLVLFALA